MIVVVFDLSPLTWKNQFLKYLLVISMLLVDDVYFLHLHFYALWLSMGISFL